MNEDVWYFAYGSNLSPARMEERVGTIRKSVRCFLRNYRLAFNKRASKAGEVYANIIPSEGDRVWGVIYLCDSDAMQNLDVWEGVSGGHYYREQVEVVADGSSAFGAIADVAGKVIPEGRPSDDYLKLILTGAKGHELPEEYIEQIKSIAGR